MISSFALCTCLNCATSGASALYRTRDTGVPTILGSNSVAGVAFCEMRSKLTEALAVSMGEAAKPFLFGGFQAGCNVVLRGRRATL